MKNEEKKPKKWWRYLIGLIIWILIICLLFIGAALADSAIPAAQGTETVGHKAPVFTILVIPLIVIISIIVVIRTIVKIVISLRYYSQTR